MHEYSILRALLDRVEQEARRHGATAVRSVRVRIGELSGVDAGLLASAYENGRGGTLCEAAKLEIEPVPTLWACPRCGTTIPCGEPLRCGACSTPARLVAGDEILLEGLELEVP